jgi:hypothetical protein
VTAEGEARGDSPTSEELENLLAGLKAAKGAERGRDRIPCRKTYHAGTQEVEALRSVSLRIEDGDFLALPDRRARGRRPSLQPIGASTPITRARSPSTGRRSRPRRQRERNPDAPADKSASSSKRILTDPVPSRPRENVALAPPSALPSTSPTAAGARPARIRPLGDSRALAGLGD